MEEKGTHGPCDGGCITQCIDQLVSASKCAVTILRDNISLSLHGNVTGAGKFASAMIKQMFKCV